MIVTLAQYLTARELCYKCGGAIVLEYRSGNESYFRCYNTLGHYHAQLTRIGTFWDGDQRLDEEAILLNNVHYLCVDYISNKVHLVNHADELVNITVNIMDNHRIGGLLVSREGLEKLVHKASVVRHFR